VSTDGHRDDPAAIVVVRYDQERPWRWSRHSHTEHQFLWGPSGTVAVETDEHNWLVPPTLGLWIPSQVPHAVDGVRPAQVYCLYLDPDSCPIRWPEPTPVAVGSFLREAIIRLDDDSLTPAERAHTETAMFDVMRPVAVSSIHLPMPNDDRLRQIAEALLAQPGDQRSLAEWGDDVGASVRTLTRLFAIETGMTFGQWRQQARMRAALTPLAHGASVANVARMVGYSNPSAFVHAFHRITGQTPGAYFAATNDPEPVDDRVPELR
jgi:AraC-like DNA-binding protein/quercetin dioxygenase-like cupin family protein